MEAKFWFVYILKCNDGTYYVGSTQNIDERLKRHYKGEIVYTKTRLPIELIVFTALPDKYKAYNFEKYLKSGSGRAFSNRHLL